MDEAEDIHCLFKSLPNYIYMKTLFKTTQLCSPAKAGTVNASQ